MDCDINYYIVQSPLDAVVPLNLPYMGILELTLRPAPWQLHVHYAHMYMYVCACMQSSIVTSSCLHC